MKNKENRAKLRKIDCAGKENAGKGLASMRTMPTQKFLKKNGKKKKKRREEKEGGRQRGERIERSCKLC